MSTGKITDAIDIHSLGSVRLQAYWVLENIGDENDGRLSAVRIARHLVNNHGVSTSYQAVDYALKKCNGGAHKNRAGYKLMEKGRKELMRSVSSTNDNTIMIESGKPFSAKSTGIASVFSQLKGEIRVCDPYVDAHTLDLIFKNINKSTPIRILTQTVNDKPAGIVGRSLSDLKKEGFSIELRVYGNSTLHDRYIMDQKLFWLSGNSLNHLGDKESFLVALGSDVHQAMSQTFEHRWKAATIYR